MITFLVPMAFVVASIAASTSKNRVVKSDETADAVASDGAAGVFWCGAAFGRGGGIAVGGFDSDAECSAAAVAAVGRHSGVGNAADAADTAAGDRLRIVAAHSSVDGRLLPCVADGLGAVARLPCSACAAEQRGPGRE